MNFKKRFSKKIWPEEETRKKISIIRNEIATFNKELNSIDNQVFCLKYKKEIVKRKVQKKCKYLAQLQNQLGNSIHEKTMKEFIEKNRNK